MQGLLIFLGLVFIFGCSSSEKPIGSKDYITNINDWHTKRIENLKKEKGWLNLVGLYWLKEGENKIGSDSSNDITFPKKAEKILGSIFLDDSTITFRRNQTAEVYSDSNLVNEVTLLPDVSGNPTILESRTLKWFIIKRGEKYGIRLRDLEADLLTSFEGIDRFPINDNWKINAEFIPYDEPKEISIPTILGTIEKDFSPGKLKFKIGDKEFSLEPTSAGKGLFIVFADLTSGEETYGAGRFLYVDGPDTNNNVILDFNKSYNPPCAFTKYATCPLPPEENKLQIKITAGEKNYGYGH